MSGNAVSSSRVEARRALVALPAVAAGPHLVDAVVGQRRDAARAGRGCPRRSSATSRARGSPRAPPAAGRAGSARRPRRAPRVPARFLPRRGRRDRTRCGWPLRLRERVVRQAVSQAAVNSPRARCRRGRRRGPCRSRAAVAVDAGPCSDAPPAGARPRGTPRPHARVGGAAARARGLPAAGDSRARGRTARPAGRSRRGGGPASRGGSRSRAARAPVRRSAWPAS